MVLQHHVALAIGFLNAHLKLKTGSKFGFCQYLLHFCHILYVVLALACSASVNPCGPINGSSCLAALCGVTVKYFNPYTNLCILRCETSQLQQVRRSVAL